MFMWTKYQVSIKLALGGRRRGGGGGGMTACLIIQLSLRFTCVRMTFGESSFCFFVCCLLFSFLPQRLCFRFYLNVFVFVFASTSLFSFLPQCLPLRSFLTSALTDNKKLSNNDLAYEKYQGSLLLTSQKYFLTHSLYSALSYFVKFWILSPTI